MENLITTFVNQIESYCSPEQKNIVVQVAQTGAAYFINLPEHLQLNYIRDIHYIVEKLARVFTRTGNRPHFNYQSQREIIYLAASYGLTDINFFTQYRLVTNEEKLDLIDHGKF